MRLSRCEVRVHINDRDHRRLYLFYGALQRLKPPTRYICELFGAPRFSSFSHYLPIPDSLARSKQHHELNSRTIDLRGFNWQAFCSKGQI